MQGIALGRLASELELRHVYLYRPPDEYGAAVGAAFAATARAAGIRVLDSPSYALRAHLGRRLRNAGFDKFRVLLFQQSGGLNQAEAEAGLALNLDFFLAILNALNIGDIINDVAYQIRPYEVNAGETDRVLVLSLAK